MKTATYHIETFGCQMNRSDSSLMDLSMREHGFAPASREEDADIVLFNTCSVRQHAEDRAIGRMRSARRRGNRTRIIVLAGCMAQRIGPELVAKGDADLAVGPYRSPVIGALVKALFERRGGREHLSQDREDFAGRIDPRLAGNGPERRWHEWVTITHGCGNFCTYCIVPHVRGPLISFPSRDIIRQCEALAGSGVTELTLLGQNVNQYGQDCGETPFYRLLERVARVEGIQRVGFLTSHPRDFSADIIAVVRDHPAISRALHLPAQSGADRILGLMNRGYTRARYLALIELIDRELPDHAVTTDLIAGFPGETEEEFNATLDLVRIARFDEAYTYAYSPREGTTAFSMRESIPREEKLERLATLIEVQRAVSREKLAARVGRTEQVIVEAVSRKSSSEVMGRTWLNHPVVLPGGECDIGRKLAVTITEVKGSTLYAGAIA